MNQKSLVSSPMTSETHVKFGQLIERYQDRLYNSMFYLLRSHDDALDVVQDAFLQAFTHLGTFQHRCDFYTWLYRIAYNLAMGVRQKRRGAVSMEDMPDWPNDGPRDHGMDPSQWLEQREQARQLREALDRLPQNFRVLLVLREIEHFRYQTIAKILDLPIGTVRSRLHRARLRMLAYLDSEAVARRCDGQKDVC